MTTLTIEAFCRELRQFDYDVLYDAFKAVIASEKYFPVPATVSEYCRIARRKKADRFVPLPEPGLTEEEKKQSAMMARFTGYSVRKGMKFETEEDYMKAFEIWLKEQDGKEKC